MRNPPEPAPSGVCAARHPLPGLRSPLPGLGPPLPGLRPPLPGLGPVRAGVRAGVRDRAARSVCALAGAMLLLWGAAARGDDEIQVYNAEINAPGEWSLEVHANYALEGRKQGEFPGAIVPHHAWQGSPELAYGVTDWWELGLYWPYAFTNTGEYKEGGVKLRTEFVAPNGKERTWPLGINFELGYVNPAFAEQRWNLEVRPILGYRSGSEELIVNPILNYAFDKHDYRPDFAPAVRYAHALTAAWKAGIEHYANLGPLDGNLPGRRQVQTTFAIVEWSYHALDVHFGIGHGWTPASDETIAKTIVGFPF